MKALPCLVIGIFLAINNQGLAQESGFTDGLARRLEQGERLRMQRERLQMEHKIIRERMRQMELQNQLRRQEDESQVREHEMMFQKQILRMQQTELKDQDHQRALSDPATRGSTIAPRPPIPPDEK